MNFRNGWVEIWIDGGWSVDGLLGKQLRPHGDLDIALQWKDTPKLWELLIARGYEQVREDNQWNFVLANKKGREVDVYVFVYDQLGQVVDGILYPAESLTGIGYIEGHQVKCISAKYMVKFITPWINTKPNKYLPAVFELCSIFKIELPREYKEFKGLN